MDEIIVTARFKRVGVRPELLTGCIALALERLARGEFETEQFGDLAPNVGHHGVTRIEVARLAGAEVGDSHIVGDGRWPALGVDPLDQARARCEVEKAAKDE